MASTKAQTQENTQDVAKRGPSLETLRDITDFETAVKLLQQEVGAEVVSSGELGDGFTLENDKDSLIGRPMMFVHWTFSTGEHGEFVAARAIVQEKNGTFRKVVVVDGGTGICAQLRDMGTRRNAPTVVTAKRGLRKSEYDHPVHGHGVTYYIDTAS